jgi:hypothetical protein
MADHMAGINALPRWDPNNPTTFRYDWKNYDAEAKADYQRFKAAREKNDRDRQAKAEAKLKETMREVRQFIAEKTMEEAKLPLTVDGDSLTIDKPSTCFASVTWEPTDDEGNGVVTGEFHRGGALVYSGEMTLDEFTEWAADPSLGGFYNAVKPKPF